MKDSDTASSRVTRQCTAERELEEFNQVGQLRVWCSGAAQQQDDVANTLDQLCAALPGDIAGNFRARFPRAYCEFNLAFDIL